MIDYLVNFGFVKTEDGFKSVDYSLSIDFCRKLSTLYSTYMMVCDESSEDINIFVVVKKKRIIFEFRHIDNRNNFSYSNLDRNAFEYYLGVIVSSERLGVIGDIIDKE